MVNHTNLQFRKFSCDIFKQASQPTTCNIFDRSFDTKLAAKTCYCSECRIVDVAHLHTFDNPLLTDKKYRLKECLQMTVCLGGWRSNSNRHDYVGKCSKRLLLLYKLLGITVPLARHNNSFCTVLLDFSGNSLSNASTAQHKHSLPRKLATACRCCHFTMI